MHTLKEFYHEFNYFIDNLLYFSLDPCYGSPCGENSLCEGMNGVAFCSCLEGYVGSPPHCKEECVSDVDCMDGGNVCVDNRCRDACYGVCGINTECEAQQHYPSCSCIEGYTGDPFKECFPLDITTKTQGITFVKL